MKKQFIIKTIYMCLVLLIVFVFSTQKTEAAKPLTGWAWSPNIGWLSFNCTNTNSCASSNYKVEIDDSSGNFSGYAWAPHMGWVSFNSTDVSGCNTASCVPNVDLENGGNLTGSARGLTLKPGGEGWLDLTEVVFDKITGAFSGYAWSSDVGWLQFIASCPDCVGGPSCSNFNVSGVNQESDNVLINWTISNDSGQYQLTRTGPGEFSSPLNVGLTGSMFDTIPYNTSVTYNLSKSGGATCPTRSVTITPSGTSAMWVENNPTKTETRIRRGSPAIVNWNIDWPETTSCTGTYVSGSHIPSWEGSIITNLDNQSRNLTGLNIGTYEIGMECNTPTGIRPTNSVRIIVTQPIIIEI